MTFVFGIKGWNPSLKNIIMIVIVKHCTIMQST